MEGDSITIADARDFISGAKKAQEDWKSIADRSWAEVEKRNNLGKLYGGGDLYSRTGKTRFPLWWSCWKIRQPITLARLAVPVIKDTQGDDPYGRTACIIGERLTKGILKTFDALPEFSSSNDDFLVTNFGWGSWHYRSKEEKEEERIRLEVVQQEPPPPPPPEMGPDGQPMPQQPPEPLPPLFYTPDGQQIPMEQVQEDDLGPYFATGEKIKITDQEVYFEAGLYPNLLVDPEVTRWNKVTRLAFRYAYSYRDFKVKFGAAALEKLMQSDIEEHRTQNKPIIVYEYHDSVLKEVRWFAENSEDFFQPKEMPKGEDGESDYSDLYNLSCFFPCTEPLIINQSTRAFWPTPEYFQVQDILDDISSIVTRMVQLTKAIRIRFLFDGSVKDLQPLIAENWAGGEGTGMGVRDLQSTLMAGKGSLSNLVAYFPIDELMQGLQNMYTAFDQRLNMFYNVTGFSDLIRGQTSDSDKTYGERQLEGKFALNRMEPFQRKIQEWIKNNYQLGMEFALKMFSPDTLDEYITPQTLDREDQERYQEALDLLKNNRRRRFRVDFETDSTISINQEWKKTQAIETANAITKMMESTAQTAKEMPELANAELRIMKHTVAELTDGKLFMDEIADAIQTTIDKVNEPKDPEPNIEIEKIKLETRKQEFAEQRAMTEDRLEQLQMQMKEGIEVAKMGQDQELATIKAQLDQFKVAGEQQLSELKMQIASEESRAELEKEYQKISADIALSQQELELKRQEMLVELRKIADKKEVDQLSLMIDERVAGFESQLKSAQLELDKTVTMLDMKERFMTEQRLQAEHQLEKNNDKLQAVEKMLDLSLKSKALEAVEVQPKEVKPEPPKKPRKTRSKVIRDKNGDIDTILNEDIE